MPVHKLISSMSFIAALLALAGCDQQRIAKLEEGLATEADVRQQFGEPQATYEDAGGSRTFEYSRQPEGQVAYMITIGPDGKMSALRQVLNAREFAKITPGMDVGQVRRALGRPATTSKYDLKPDEIHWEWRWMDGQAPKIFVITFNPDGKVVSTVTRDDPRETLKPA
jgi:outer membrane protein assembly factor BamE (lipoprotein component of BamABCDE complex)